MLIIIKLKKMILILKIYFYQILQKKNVTFVTLFSKHADKKKIHILFFHYSTKKQFGGSKSTTLPINILKRGSITYFSINFTRNKNFYDFFASDIVDDFLQSVYEVYHPQENKIQAFFEIINQ